MVHIRTTGPYKVGVNTRIGPKEVTKAHTHTQTQFYSQHLTGFAVPQGRQEVGSGEKEALSG